MANLIKQDIEIKIQNRIKNLSAQRSISKIRQLKRKKRTYETVYVTPSNKCFLCNETRMLERAHVIPMSLWSDIEDNIKIPEPFLYVMALCPTHHRCYDNYMLTPKEKNHIMQITNHDSRYAFEALLESSHGYVGISETILEQFLNTSWKWWRNYYASAQ